MCYLNRTYRVLPTSSRRPWSRSGPSPDGPRARRAATRPDAASSPATDAGAVCAGARRAAGLSPVGPSIAKQLRPHVAPPEPVLACSEHRGTLPTSRRNGQTIIRPARGPAPIAEKMRKPNGNYLDTHRIGIKVCIERLHLLRTGKWPCPIPRARLTEAELRIPTRVRHLINSFVAFKFPA